MCVIIEKKPGIEVPFDKIEAACHHNSDGYGYMYFDDNKLVWRKDFSEKGNDPEKIAKILQELKDKKVYLHLRIRTSGTTDLASCHPFKIANKKEHGADVYLMHNGVLSQYDRGDQTRPDSFHFGTEVISPLYMAFHRTWKGSPLNDELFRFYLEKCLGNNSSKIALLDSSGAELILNRKAGHDFDWGWASNNHYFWKPSSSWRGSDFNSARGSFRDEDEVQDADWWDADNYGEYGCYPFEPTRAKGNVSFKDVARKASTTKDNSRESTPEQAVSQETVQVDHSSRATPGGVPITYRSPQALPSIAGGSGTTTSVPRLTGPKTTEDGLKEAAVVPVSSFPKTEVRQRFLDAAGVKAWDLREMCSWQEEDFRELMDTFSDHVPLLLMDLLELVYDKPVARTVN